MTVFEYEDYKQYVNGWVAAHPRQGYGYYSKIAEALDTNSVIISQVFKGLRDLNLEQAAKLCEFMTLNTVESDYFLVLVQLSRSGSAYLTRILKRQMKELRFKGQAIKNRIEHENLSPEDQSIFYSTWFYIAIWLAAPVPAFGNVSDLSRHFQLPESVVREVLNFLIEKKLLLKSGHAFHFGPNVIHIPHDSPFVTKHHSNWRLRALQSMDRKNEENLHYTAPMSMSEDLALQIREQLVQFIQKQTKLVAASRSEKLVCLNIDWFSY